jgi:hypothetical protein
VEEGTQDERRVAKKWLEKKIATQHEKEMP